MGGVTPAACPLGSGICLILLYIAVLPIDGVVRAARGCGRVVWSAVARPVECSWLTVHKVGGQKYVVVVAVQLALGSLKRQFSLHAAVYICRTSTLDVYPRLRTLCGAAM